MSKHYDADERRRLATIESVANRPAAIIKHSATKQQFSKKLYHSASASQIVAVCDLSGIVVTVGIPNIPGQTLEYISPLSSVANCRGIAQQGKDYMRKLDTQILAGILIILADNYDLFRAQPTDSGAQKNAVLRTVAKDILIDCILFIEDFIHSSNAAFCPKLSIIFDKETVQNGVQARVQSWLSSAVEAIAKPDLRSYEEAVNTVNKSIKPKTVASVNRAAIAFNKEFREWKKDSKQLIISMAAKKEISNKLRDYLLTVVQGDNLAMADISAVALLSTKLQQLNLDHATKLAIKLVSYKDKLTEQSDSSDLWNEQEAAPNFASKPVGVYIADKQAEGMDRLLPIASQSTATAPASQDSSELTHSAPKGMSVIEAIKARKRAAAAQNTAIQQNSPAQQDDALF